MKQIQADAEQAKSTGGMVALFPRREDAEKMAYPGGEPVEDLHVTLAYLGEDVSGLGSSLSAQRIIEDIAEWTPPLEARVFGHATLNPDSYSGREPCAVYLIGDNDRFESIYQEVQREANARYELPKQHSPWLVHLTAGYGLSALDLDFTGTIVFDRITLEWAGETYEAFFGGNL